MGPRSAGDHDSKQQRRPSSQAEILSGLAASYNDLFRVSRHHGDIQPFVGAQPLLLREPRVYSQSETQARTAVVSDKIQTAIENASSILLVAAQDASYSPTIRSLLKMATDDDDDTIQAPRDQRDTIAIGMDWLQLIPSNARNCSRHTSPPHRWSDDQLLICVGTTSKYLNKICLGDPIMHEMDDAYQANNLIVVTKSAVMLPIGTQEQNVFGVDSNQVLTVVADALHERAKRLSRPLQWGHGAGTKTRMLSFAFAHLPVASRLHHLPSTPALPADPLSVENEKSSNDTPSSEQELTVFDHVADFIAFQNDFKLSLPTMNVANYYDTGLCVSLAQKYAINRGISLLMDRDGLAMNRDASIGHTLSKMNQVIVVEPYRSTKGIYNFFVGDGAMRLNGGAELALYLMGLGDHSQKLRKGPSSLTTLFVFVNENWAVEDNLIQTSREEHKLYNRKYYELLAVHPNVHMCKGEAQLRQTISDLTAKQLSYVRGDCKKGELNVVLIADLDLRMPPAILPNSGVDKSPEVLYLRKTLAAFAEGCEMPVPLYGCSAYEYLQFLHAFMGTSEGSRYEFVTGMTDIQASQMCGFDHPEGRSVLFMNDVFGIHSLGETLRMNQSGLGDNQRQLLIFVWHPTLLSTSDHFQPHRPPCFWPSVSTMLTKFYVLKEKDACFVDFDGTLSTVDTVRDAISNKTPLILINMLPEQERNFVQLDIRVKY